MSVTRAARTRYSTPKVRTSQGGDRLPSTGAPTSSDRLAVGPGSASDVDAHDASRDARPGCGRPVVAFGSPVAMIRHRFGGHLRAARAWTCVAVRHAPPSAPADALGGHRRRGSGPEGDGRQTCVSCRPRPGDSDRGSLRDRRTIRTSGGECMKLTRVGAVAAAALFVFAACSGDGGGGAGTKGTIEVWSSLPRQGSSKAQTDTMANAIKMALEERGGVVAGYNVTYKDVDDSTAAAGKWDEQTEIKNANDAVANDKRRGLHRHAELGRGQAVDPDPLRQGHRHGQPGEHRRRPHQAVRARASPTSTTRTAARATTPASSRTTCCRARPARCGPRSSASRPSTSLTTPRSTARASPTSSKASSRRTA